MRKYKTKNIYYLYIYIYIYIYICKYLLQLAHLLSILITVFLSLGIWMMGRGWRILVFFEVLEVLSFFKVKMGEV